MKKMIRNTWLKVTTAIFLILFSVAAFAQDKGVDVDINVNKNNQWYQQPWVWIVGGAVFILLLVALLRGGQKKGA